MAPIVLERGRVTDGEMAVTIDGSVPAGAKGGGRGSMMGGEGTEMAQPGLTGKVIAPEVTFGADVRCAEKALPPRP